MARDVYEANDMAVKHHRPLLSCDSSGACGEGTERLRAPDLLHTSQWIEIADLLSLSPREAQMVRQACYDENVAVMAECMGLSAHTVHTYRERLYRKLGVRSLCQVVAVAFTTHVRLEGQRRRSECCLHAHDVDCDHSRVP